MNCYITKASTSNNIAIDEYFSIIWIGWIHHCIDPIQITSSEYIYINQYHELRMQLLICLALCIYSQFVWFYTEKKGEKVIFFISLLSNNFCSRYSSIQKLTLDQYNKPRLYYVHLHTEIHSYPLALRCNIKSH